MATPAQLFKERAHWLKRDLREGTISAAEVPEYIRSDWEKDEDEFRSSYGVTSYAQFKAGVMAAMGSQAKPTSKRKAAPKRSTKAKPAEKRVKAKELVNRACKSRHLPAFLRKRYC